MYLNIVFLPFLGSFIGGFFGRFLGPHGSAIVTTSCIGSACLMSLVAFFEVNPYFFSFLIALNLQTSFLTPPMAMSAYYLKGVQSKNVELMEIFRGIMPFLGIVIFAMFLMYLFPGIALWLPDTLFAN